MFNEFLPHVRHHVYDYSTRAHLPRPPIIVHEVYVHMIPNLGLFFQTCSTSSLMLNLNCE